ncbi:methyltransferase domain-containing protein [Sulfurisoma sediminicola]|uniref:Methyltransferase family protein n=1 Tax=Sulfurisoma sediminicola TaxID=1381557 RepID=A0A497XAQ5_9PROT|nr:methyltransferase domain-containing protein [Sulfurisoma sediminicola]RLJ63644.1 methyltransferase family protein [Sulfurisoma sediminicola]
MTRRIDLELAVRWQDRRAHYRDRRIFHGIDPSNIRIGESSLHSQPSLGAAATVAEGMLLGPADARLRIATARSDWPIALGGQRIEPRPGRWFPRLVLAGRQDFSAGDRAPMRVIDADAQTVTVDLNPPLAGLPLAIDATVLSSASSQPAAAAGDLLPQLLANGPGMQAVLAGGAATSPLGEDFARSDEGSDGDFYAAPRFVDHLDATALEHMRILHRRFLAPGMRVLDLMASCNSHLPDDATDIGVSVSGLGMNADELARNPRLAQHVVQDLNANPTLPFAAAEFDTVLCALSVEYLVQPLAVFDEVARVLKPGGIFLASFSERWFPPKAIRLWSELHPFERIGLVLEYFSRSGKFSDLHAESLRGLPRPPDDKYYRMTKLSDPIYAVWGKVPPTASNQSG